MAERHAAASDASRMRATMTFSLVRICLFRPGAILAYLATKCGPCTCRCSSDMLAVPYQGSEDHETSNSGTDRIGDGGDCSATRRKRGISCGFYQKYDQPVLQGDPAWQRHRGQKAVGRRLALCADHGGQCRRADQAG